MEEIELASWDLLLGIPKSVNAAKQIIRNKGIMEKPQNFVRKAKVTNVYVILVNGNIYGMKRNTAVYPNPMKALNEREDRNS